MHANVSDRLLQHYVDKYRRLPWRSPPGSPPPAPYLVWLSEVMLQQTTVSTVVPRFRRFLERWPTVEALAAARDEEVLSEWAGLGYYARARNLIACAREVARRGGFPDTDAELRKLPGIGDYTAAAVAAIAFGKRAVVIDSNVERVAARLAALRNPGKPQLRRFVETITPAERCGDFAQAMMDLGAGICRPRDPLCGECPLSAQCAAFATGTPDRFPARKAKKPKPVRHGVAHWVEQDNAIWLIRRPPNGLLGSMPAIPGGEWTLGQQEPQRPTIARIRHIFTHFSLDLDIVESAETPEGGWWQDLDSIGDAGLPTLYLRAVESVLATRGRLAA